MHGQASAVGSGPFVVDVSVFRPPRLNFAGVCIWCGRVGCASRGCARRHERSWWGPCLECWAGLDGVDGCICSPGCEHGVALYDGQAEAQEAARQFLALVAVPEGLRNFVLRFPTIAEGLAAAQQAHVSGEVTSRAA